MTHEIVSVLCGGPGLEGVPDGEWVRTFDNTANKFTPCEAYQDLLETSDKDIIIYAHDDVTIHYPDWLSSVLALSQLDETIVAVGLGGATGLANADLYRKPFNIWNLARRGYASNQTDAEVHGERFAGSKRVAVLDAFFMAVRRDWITSVGGWPVDHLSHHCLDLWLACEAARRGKETWMVGVNCTHHGGGSSTKPAYAKAAWLKGGSMEQDHIQPHRWLWDEYRDVLPLELA